MNHGSIGNITSVEKDKGSIRVQKPGRNEDASSLCSSDKKLLAVEDQSGERMSSR